MIDRTKIKAAQYSEWVSNKWSRSGSCRDFLKTGLCLWAGGILFMSDPLGAKVQASQATARGTTWNSAVFRSDSTAAMVGTGTNQPIENRISNVGRTDLLAMVNGGRTNTSSTFLGAKVTNGASVVVGGSVRPNHYYFPNGTVPVAPHRSLLPEPGIMWFSLAGAFTLLVALRLPRREEKRPIAQPTSVNGLTGNHSGRRAGARAIRAGELENSPKK